MTPSPGAGATSSCSKRWRWMWCLSRGVTTAQTSIVDADSHCFLESERFDRVGIRGRVAVLSLAAVHDDPADPWARAAVFLRDAGCLSREDAGRLQWLDAFGALIANTDRHPYNVVFFADGATLRLAPAFDQVSMLYAPTADGQVPPRTFAPPHATADTLEVWDDARAAAREFWQRASDDARVSDDVRAIPPRTRLRSPLIKSSLTGGEAGIRILKSVFL